MEKEGEAVHKVDFDQEGNLVLKKKENVKTFSTQIESGEVTDLTYLKNFCEGDEDRIKKYINMYLTSAPLVVEKIKLALKHNDFEEVANHVHGFKTKYIMMGMTETNELSNTIEHLCRESSEDPQLTEKIMILIRTIEKAENELRN